MRNKWSEAEIELVRQLYSTVHVSEIAKRLVAEGFPARSIRSIQTIAERKGIKLIPRWSKEEKDVIRKYYRNGINTVHRKLKERGYDRSFSAVRNKCSNMLLTNNRNYWTNTEIALLKQYRHLPASKIMAFLDRSENAISNQLRRTGLTHDRTNNLSDRVYCNAGGTDRRR